MGRREKTSGLSQSVRVFFLYTYFVSCNGPCVPKEKWHRKEHIIIKKISELIICDIYASEFCVVHLDAPVH